MEPPPIKRPSRTVLLAETDQHTLNRLPCILSEHLPHVGIDICPSSDQLPRMLKHASYDTVAMSPALLQEYRVLPHNSGHSLRVPIIVTAGRDDRSMAESALKDEAFDVIVKPIVPQEAVQTVRLALWHNQLVRLLASKERAAFRFHAHMKMFPHAVTMEQEFVGKMAAYERTIGALSTSMQWLLNTEEERSAYDMAAVVEQHTRQRALDRLLNLCKDDPTQ